MNYSSIAPRERGLRGHIIGWSDGLIRNEPRSVAYGQLWSAFSSLDFVELGVWYALCLFIAAKIVSNFLCRRLSGSFWTNDGFLEYVLLLSPGLALGAMIIRYLLLSSSSWTNDLGMLCLWLTVTPYLLPAPNRTIKSFYNVVVSSTIFAGYYVCDIPTVLSILFGLLTIRLFLQTILKTRRIGLRSDLLSYWA